MRDALVVGVDNKTLQIRYFNVAFLIFSHVFS
jgi:hypothetical protein